MRWKIISIFSFFLLSFFFIFLQQQRSFQFDVRPELVLLAAEDISPGELSKSNISGPNQKTKLIRAIDVSPVDPPKAGGSFVNAVKDQKRSRHSASEIEVHCARSADASFDVDDFHPKRRKKEQRRTQNFLKYFGAAIRVFNELNMTYVVSGGVLLNLYRDCRLRDEVDIDVFVFEDDFDVSTFDTSFRAIPEEYFFISMDPKKISGKVDIDQNGRIYRLSYKGTRLNPIRLLDIFIVRKEQDHFWYTYDSDLLFWNHPYKIAQLQINEMEIAVPYPPICHILERYGPYWNEYIPNEDWKVLRKFDLRDVPSWKQADVDFWLSGVLHEYPGARDRLKENWEVSGVELLAILDTSNLDVLKVETNKEMLLAKVQQLQRLHEISTEFTDLQQGFLFRHRTTIPSDAFNTTEAQTMRGCTKNPKKWIDFYKLSIFDA